MITTTLEQSHKLKSIGAPQDTRNVWIQATNNGSWFLRERVKGNGELAAYTLSELIEWLGDNLEGLHHLIMLNETGMQWQAISQEDANVFSGKTPLEAIYNLAVAIKSNHTGGENNE